MKRDGITSCRLFWLSLFWLSLISVIGPVLPVRGQEKIDFGRDVQPILANHCYACHGPDEKVREAGLRLDLRQSAVEMGRSCRGRQVIASWFGGS